MFVEFLRDAREEKIGEDDRRIRSFAYRLTGRFVKGGGSGKFEVFNFLRKIECALVKVTS